MQNVHTRSPLSVHGFAHPARNVAALPIQGGMHVADFGAGSGAYVLAIAERLGGAGRVYAIDVQRDLLRRISSEAAHRGYKNVDVIWSDLELPRASKLRDKSMDLVLISNLLFQVPDKLPVLREAKRITKDSGHTVVIDWSEPITPHHNAAASRAGSVGPRREEILGKQAAIELAAKVQLELVREFTAGAHHYGLIFRPVAAQS